MTMVEGGFQILVVDDEPDLCWALDLFLKSKGHHPHIAKNAMEAMALVQKETFDLAFVDVKLSDLDGLELVRKIHRHDPGLPCFLMSGYFFGEDSEVESGLQSGEFAGFITKPFPVDHIQDAILKARVTAPASRTEN